MSTVSSKIPSCVYSKWLAYGASPREKLSRMAALAYRTFVAMSPAKGDSITTVYVSWGHASES